MTVILFGAIQKKIIENSVEQTDSILANFKFWLQRKK